MLRIGYGNFLMKSFKYAVAGDWVMRKNAAFLVVVVLVSLVSILPVHALELQLGDAFSTVGKWLSDIFSNEYATFGVTIIVLTILLRSIFAASLKRVKIFEGAGGEGVGPMGNTVSWTMAILSSIGLFYLKGNNDVGTFMQKILGPAGMWVAIIIVIVLYLWLKGATGSGKWGLFLTGFSSIVISNMVDWPMLGTAGAFMIVAGFFWLIAGFARSRRGVSAGEIGSASRAEDRLQRGLDSTMGDDIAESRDLGSAQQFSRDEERLTQAEEQEALQEGNYIQAMRSAALRLGPNDLVQNAPRVPDYQRATVGRLEAEKQPLILEIRLEAGIFSKIKAVRQKISQGTQRLLSLEQKVKQREKRPEEISNEHERTLQKELGDLKKIVDERRQDQTLVGDLLALDQALRKTNNEIIELINGTQAWLGRSYGGYTRNQFLVVLSQIEMQLQEKAEKYGEKEHLIREFEKAENDAKKYLEDIVSCEKLAEEIIHKLEALESAEKTAAGKK
jgi:hypothetical protein